jgi:hypothetical protein
LLLLIVMVVVWTIVLLKQVTTFSVAQEGSMDLLQRVGVRLWLHAHAVVQAHG